MKFQYEVGTELAEKIWYPRIWLQKFDYGHAFSFIWFKYFAIVFFIKDDYVAFRGNDHLEPQPVNVDDLTSEEIDQWVRSNNKEREDNGKVQY